MSKVRIEVELTNGTAISFEKPTSFTAIDPASAIRELDRGYNLVRSWLTSQLPPAEQQVVEKR